jgi:putative transposase
MVAQPSEYVWSSYQINTLGKVSNLCTPHCLYTALGMALGNDRFKSELTSLIGRRLHALPPGRKLGWRKN